MTKGLYGLALSSLLLSGTALAQNVETPGIDQRMQNQEQRIQQGIDSGQLTEREAGRMNRHMDRVEKAEARAKADGQVTRQERKRMKRALNHNSRAIYREKHDRQRQ
ncbi:MAG TPA: hypothetical protein VJ692_00465 [Nitrospiraceae bacterium]|nr:hypothetical protein [Nitrospiraceae bacterium]